MDSKRLIDLGWSTFLLASSKKTANKAVALTVCKRAELKNYRKGFKHF
jgi:hypothetical protein